MSSIHRLSTNFRTSTAGTNREVATSKTVDAKLQAFLASIDKRVPRLTEVSNNSQRKESLPSMDLHDAEAANGTKNWFYSVCSNRNR
jgi:hypothetical protein